MAVEDLRGCDDEDSLSKAQLAPLFKVLTIPSADKIKGGPFGDVDAVPTNYVIDRYGVLSIC